MMKLLDKLGRMSNTDLVLVSAGIAGSATAAIGLVADGLHGFDGGLSNRTVESACIVAIAASVAAMRGLRQLHDGRVAMMNRGRNAKT